MPCFLTAPLCLTHLHLSSPPSLRFLFRSLPPFFFSSCEGEPGSLWEHHGEFASEPFCFRRSFFFLGLLRPLWFLSLFSASGRLLLENPNSHPFRLRVPLAVTTRSSPFNPPHFQSPFFLGFPPPTCEQLLNNNTPRNFPSPAPISQPSAA